MYYLAEKRQGRGGYKRIFKNVKVFAPAVARTRARRRIRLLRHSFWLLLLLLLSLLLYSIPFFLPFPSGRFTHNNLSSTLNNLRSSEWTRKKENKSEILTYMLQETFGWCTRQQYTVNRSSSHRNLLYMLPMAVDKQSNNSSSYTYYILIRGGRRLFKPRAEKKKMTENKQGGTKKGGNNVPQAMIFNC